MRKSGTVSFKLPEYQRPYDWDRSNVRRLLQDCLGGLKRLASDSNADDHGYTFLVSIILTTDEDKESVFDGESLAIVDGQQRLTTLMLLSCALCRELASHQTDIAAVTDAKVKQWIKQECDEQLTRL